MLNKLSEISGIHINKNEHNIIESELNDMICELKILSEFVADNDKNLQNSVSFCELRADQVNQSYEKEKILNNSKSKNSDGFLVNKII